jgi:hypothetical protein
VIDPDLGECPAIALECVQDFEHRRVLGRLGYEVPSTTGEGSGGADQSQVVGLGCARGEDNLSCRSGAEESDDGASRFFKGGEGIASRPVIAA